MKKLLSRSISLICAVLLLSAAGCGNAGGAGEGTGAQRADMSAAGADTQPVSDESSENNLKPTVNSAEDGLTIERSSEKFTNSSFLDEIKPYEGSTLKIAFVGDGVTYGNGTSDRFSESITAQFSTLMDNTVRAGNFGKPSAYVLPPDNPYNVKADKPGNWYQNTSQFQKSLEYMPDIVVIMLGTNDFRSMSCEQAKADYKEALLDLAGRYKALDSVKKIYIATSIIGCSNAAIYEMMSGPFQEIQKEAAAEGGYEVIDIFSATRSFLDSELHFSKSRQNPDEMGCAEIAGAFYAFFKEQPFSPGRISESTGKVVYVKTGGETPGDGSSPEKPTDSLAKAAALLKTDGGSIVLCGDCEIGYEMVLPVTEKPITITSEYGGTNYGAKLGLAHNLHFNGDYTIENVHVNVTKDGGMFVCGYNNVTFGEGITSSWGGDASGYPGITAGFNQQIAGCPADALSLHGKRTVTVSSGHWSFIRGGNTRGNGGLHPADIAAGAELEVNITGGVFENLSGRNLTAATGMNSVSGLCRMNISGGVFLGPVFAVARHGALPEGDTCDMSGTAELEITGGRFDGGIKCLQDDAMKVTGRTVLNISTDLAQFADTGGFSEVNIR